MAVPLIYSYSAAALVAAHTAFRDLLDAGPGAASLKIRSSTDVLLWNVGVSEGVHRTELHRSAQTKYKTQQ